MTNTFSLGKNSKFGEIDFSKLKSGISKEELGIQEGSILDSIWKSIDTNQVGNSEDKLDRQELQAFIDKIKTLCGKDTNLSTGEAKKYVYGENEKGKELKLGRKNKEELLTFLSKLSELTKGIANVETEATTDIETITYEDGHKEQIKPDGSKVIISKDGKTITEKDANGNTTKETVKTDNEETVTEFEQDSTNPKKQTITSDSVQSVILYTQGKPIKKTTTNTETSVVQEFEYVNGNEVLKKTTNSNNGEITIHNGNNSTTTTTTEEGTTIIERNGNSVTRKKTTTQTEQGEQISDITYDGKNSTENISIDGKPRSQKMVVDGTTYEVNYDEDGNTLGVVVQNGESIQAIADKFGVSPEKLIKANAKLLKGRRCFMVGEQIKIPRQIDAKEFASTQAERKDAEGAKADYNAAVARKRAEAARREAERQANIETQIAKGQNGYYVTKTNDGNLRYRNSKGKEISGEEFKKHCPTIHKQVINAQKGATKRTHKKYDTDTIRKQSSDLAKKIHAKISGASVNENTINMLRGITPENAAFVVSEYQRMYNVSLAKDVDDEWGLDLNTVKEYVCKKLVAQAKKLGLKGIYYGDYQKINDLKSLQAWINNATSKIINFMSNATETYYATAVEETQRQSAAEATKTAKASAEQIVNDLIKNADGWNDIDKIKAAIARIDNPEELKEVNRLLTLKGYPPTDKYSSIEHFIYDESDHSISHTYNSSDYLEQTVQNWINNGTLTGKAANEAQARMAARVLYDGGDGFGTDCNKMRKAVSMIKCPKSTGNREADNKQAREVYRLVNQMIKKHNTFYGLGSPCTDLLDYCKGEMWDSEVKYLNGILAETNAIQGEEKAQAIHDLTKEAVEGVGTDPEALKQAIKGIDSPKDRKAVETKLKEYCERKGIKPQIEGQAYLQAILYDECDTFLGISTDHKEIRKFNEMLIAQGAYTDEEAVNLRAEQAVLQILEGDFDNIKDAVEQLKDPQVLTKVEQLLTTKGYASLDDFLYKKLDQTKSDLINAELASKNLLPNEKAADVAFRLIKNSDFNKRAQGIRAIRNEEVAKLVDEKLKSEGSSLAKVMEQFNKEKAEYKSKAEFWNGLGKFIPLAGVIAEDISDAYKTNTDSSDNMFVEMGQAQNITDEQKASYLRTVQIMEQKLEQMEKDYQEALDSQNALSWAVNQFCERYGIGTTREEIEARIEHDKETVRLLKLAAEGKLGKMVDGKTVAVSFDEVFKERNINTDFDTTKVEKVEKQAQTLVAMNYAKTNIAVCWEELENGLNSSDSKRLSIAIIDTIAKLTNMSGQQFSLQNEYSVKDGVIVDSNGNQISVEALKELANELKAYLSEISENLFGEAISLDTTSSDINDVLDKLYNNKKESFKQEFKDAFGQDCPDEMIENYISTIETGEMVASMGAMIGAAILAPVTAGGSIATFLGVSATTGATIASGLGVAATSVFISGIRHSTDADGWTNLEWTSDVEQALWDGILTTLGMRVGITAEAKAVGTYKTAAQTMLKKWIPNITEKTLDRASVCIARVRAMGYEVSSDAIQSLAQTYCQHGEFDEEAFVRDLLMSVAGNTVGHVVGGIGDARGSKANADIDVPEEYPSAEAARRGGRDDIADGEVARNADQSHLNAKERAMVEDGLDGVPTKKELDAYQRENGYQEPTPEERAAIDRNNAEAAEANAEAHQIRNNVNEASADALRRARENAHEVDNTQNGVFKDNLGNEYTLTEGKITEIRTSDGRVINDELKIAKFTSKRNINLAELEPVKTDAPDAEAPHTDEPENVKGTANNIEPQYRRTSDEFISDELVRNVGNDGKPINENYIQASKDLREHYNQAIANGTYADTYENYVQTISQGHKVAFGGFDGKHTWYKGVGKGRLNVNPGIIREKGIPYNDRVTIGETVEDIAKKYNDNYSTTNKISNVKLAGISEEALPSNLFTRHYYPDSKYMQEYFVQMQRTAKEALELIEKGASQDEILEKLAEHYQYAANARPFGQINNSLFMNEINTLLQKAGMKPMPHGILDHVAQRFQPDTFKKYFIDEYKKTALDIQNSKAYSTNDNIVDSGNVKQTDVSAEAPHIDEPENVKTADKQAKNPHVDEPNNNTKNRNIDPIRERAYKKFNKNAQPIDMPKNGILDPNSQYILNVNDLPRLRLIDGTVVDLNNAEISNMIKNLQDGEFITLGRDGDIKIADSQNMSRHHILITKENGQIQLKDVSLHANTRAMSQAEWKIRENAINKFNKNQASVEMPSNEALNTNDNYILDFDNLPKLRLNDGTIIDLNTPKYYNSIKHLKNGGFITLGRTGYADIGISNSTNISRHHILLTIQDGQLILKDVSLNGGTYKARSTSENSRNSYRSEGSGRAHESSASASSNLTTNEYKELLGIPKDIQLTKEVVKKAYRKKCLEWHPDRNPGREENAHAMMTKINIAKEALDKLVSKS